MRSSHQLLTLPVFAGIAAAGLCRPGTSSITTAIAAIETETSVNADTKTSLTQTLSFSASETIPATTLETFVPVTESSVSETTTAPLIETSAPETTTAAFADFTSDTTLATSFVSSSTAETTSASEIASSQATTTTSPVFPPQPIICPGSDRMCLYNMDIRCDYQLAGLPKDGNMSLDECAEKCGNDASCILFSWAPSDSSCSMGSYDDLEVEDLIPGVVSGTKGECEEPEP
ncbi:uncharacterized protein FIESC28_01991 [Fusarium coffeatum]|uniref:PAN-3 domain-containing protein n=1 Tax=Fusarium coffeatum TaxID=231269 RepID=A0A366S995_9HYPO|nr:uncharacterized protein FIESC28_01991 [Fusarium coffeatum]RBR25256.1 hypothetical protein FIESC28_01991 [Fusarium coffeatum]